MDIVENSCTDKRVESPEKMLENIIVEEAIYPVYQPIVSLYDGAVLGYEGLSRVRGEQGFPNVEDMFKEAERTGKIWRLEQICRKAVLQGVNEQQEIFERENRKLFLNVNPQILHDAKFQMGFTKEYLRRYGIDTEKIIFEVTERESVENQADFVNAVEHYKKQGYQIAIDDVGDGYSGLNLICSVSPHYVKLDIHLIRNLIQNQINYAMVKGLVEFSVNSGILLIAEGIETKQELEILIELGVQYGQGYYLYRPMPRLQEEREELCREIQAENKKKLDKKSVGLNQCHIKNLVSPGFVVCAKEKAEDVQGYMERNKEIQGVCVVEESRVLGVLTREKLFRKLSGRYGFSLHQNKPIIDLAERNFLKVEGEMPVSSVAELAMERETEKLYDYIVVTEHDSYSGIVTVQNLLRKATEIAVNSAKSSNPLTGLPGNVLIEEEIRKCVEEKSIYTIYYFDLDNFKAFNDVYGFEKGDEVILNLAEVLKQNSKEGDFLGHIGGDDFVAIKYDREEPGYKKKIVEQFEKKAHMHYSEADRRRKSILAKNRGGVIEKFPLVSVTIVSVSDRDNCPKNAQKLIEMLAKNKKEEKVRKRFCNKKLYELNEERAVKGCI